MIATAAAAALVVYAAAGPWQSEKIGDRLQIALPLAGTICATARGGLGEYAARFGAGFLLVHGSKNALGSTPINMRPDGDTHGFPSGHTFAASYGAAFMARECGALVPGLGAVVVVAAGYVGGSRIEADKHTLNQVLAGALVGVGADVLLRRHKLSHVLVWLFGWLRARIPFAHKRTEKARREREEDHNG